MLKSKANIWIVLTGLFCCIALTNQAFAHQGHRTSGKEHFELYFDNWHLRGQQTVFLKKELRRQYPRVDFRNVELRRVEVLAKTRRSRGLATLRVGNHYSRTRLVRGHPEDFHRRDRYFQRVAFRNPKNDSSGPWQLQLRGNFKIDSVKLVLVQRDRRHSARHGDFYRDNDRAPQHSHRSGGHDSYPARRVRREQF